MLNKPKMSILMDVVAALPISIGLRDSLKDERNMLWTSPDLDPS